MELDELKKSWNALDAQLQKEPIADEKQIKELIANYKTNTRHSLGRLVISFHQGRAGQMVGRNYYSIMRIPSLN